MRLGQRHILRIVTFSITVPVRPRHILGIAGFCILFAVLTSTMAEGFLEPGRGIRDAATPKYSSPGLWIGGPLAGNFPVQKAVRTVAIGCLATYLSQQFEEPRQMARLLDNGFLEVPVDVGDFYGGAATLGSGALGLYLMGRLAGKPVLRDVGSDLCRSLLVSGTVVWTIKLASGRTRPNGGEYSFPSGHTAAAFSVAPVLQRHFGARVGIPAYALAFFTGLGRMEDRRHYLSDIVFGAFVGLGVGDAIAGSGNLSKFAEHISIGPHGVALSTDF